MSNMARKRRDVELALCAELPSRIPAPGTMSTSSQFSGTLGQAIECDPASGLQRTLCWREEDLNRQYP